MNERAIENLPINGRDFQSFVFLTPGAVQSGRNTVSLAGNKGIETNFQVDGADRNNPFFGGQSGGDRPPFTFSQEAVREFVVIKDGFSAEFGRSSAGVVNVVTKSGTNDWHGSAFYLYQDNSFIADEKSLRVNTDGSMTESRNEALGRRHQFGGSFGGPVVRDKAFFFFSTEHQDFSRPLFVEFRFDDAERALIKDRIPQLLDFEGAFNSTDNAHVYLGKFDWNATETNNFSVRYTFTDSTQVNGTTTGTTRGAVDNNGLELDRTHQFVASWNGIISPRAINEFRFNYLKEDRPREANVNDNTSEVRIGSEATVGGRWFLPIPEIDDRYQFVDNFSYNFGAHDLRVGFEYNDTGVDQIFFGNGRGQYRFADLDAFLADAPRDYRQRFGTGKFKARVQEPAFYIQDEWDVNRYLTVNLGLRWEGQLNPDNKKPNADFPAFSKKIVDDKDNWAPRVGLAWDVTGEGKTVVKASGGIFYGRTPMLLYSNPLVVNGDVNADVEIQIRGSAPVVPIATGGESFPGYSQVFNNLADAAAARGIQVPSSGTFPGADVHLHDLNFQNPESYRGTIALEQEVAANWVTTVSYTHAESRHREIRRDINLFPGTPGPDGRLIYGNPFSPNRPFADITTGRINLVESGSISDYDGLTFSLNKRYSNRFQFQANYTLAYNDSLEDNERDATTVHPTVPDNLLADFGRSNLDVRHNFVAHGVLDLPLDFQVSGIFFVNSGRPWNARTNFDNNGDGNNNDRPVINGSVVERNAFENDRFINLDLRVTKHIAFTDTARATAFIEFFNLFNERNFIVVNTTFGRTGFGVPTRQAGDPFSFQLGFRFDF
ncbi:MAG: TonB-dependent receptor plug domain-containing protein [Acidobacteriota bacterium]